VSTLHEAKQKHLKDMVLMGEIPLRTGALLALQQFHLTMKIQCSLPPSSKGMQGHAELTLMR